MAVNFNQRGLPRPNNGDVEMDNNESHQHCLSEYATSSDNFSDFCLWDYQPLAEFEGKLRSAALLFNSFEATGAGQGMFELVDAIRRGFGVSKTVWGVKKRDECLSWEYYFYDYRLEQRQRSMSKLLEILSPFTSCDVPVNEQQPYFMFSIDVDDDLLSGGKDLGEIHMYIGNTGSTVSSGISYSLTKDATRLENLYYFFDAQTQKKQIASKVGCSAYIESRAAVIEQVLWPELCDCSVIVVANKKKNDSVYFSRINIDQLYYFLARLNYPTEICRYVEEHFEELDHMLYDVGIDYRREGDQVVILKSGYYGTF